MFKQTIELFDIIYSSHMNDTDRATEEIIKNKEELIKKNLKEVELILEEIKTSREEGSAKFIITFKDILNTYIRDAGEDALSFRPGNPRYFEASTEVEFYGTPSSPPSLHFMCQSRILRRLFFNDMLFSYFDFCYRINSKFKIKTSLTIDKLKETKYLMSSLRTEKRFSRDELRLDYLMDLVYGEYNVYSFSEELLNIVSNTLHITKDEIHKSLYTVLYKNLGSYSMHSGLYFYETVHHCLELYSQIMGDLEERNLKNDVTSLVPLSERENFFEIYKKEYLSCLSLNIRKEYEKNSHLPVDDRFSTYVASKLQIEGCKACRKCCEDMLKNAYCVNHQDLLKDIRAEYFKIMDDILLKESISGFKRINCYLFNIYRASCL